MILNITHLKNLERGLSLNNKMGKYLFVGCFPGPYEMGMANLGYQSVLKTVFDSPQWRVERLFTDTGIRTFEKSIPVAEADIVGLTLGFEIEIFSLVQLFMDSGLEVYANKRAENQPLVLVGGPLASLNPEIIAPFADIVFIGESEESLPDLLTAWEEAQDLDLSRQETLLYLSRFPGVYVPRFYFPMVKGSIFKGFEKVSGVPERIQKQRVDVSRFEVFSHIYTSQSFFKNMGLMEINRGCSYRCRFCAGGAIYRPLRQRPIEMVMKMIDNLEKFTSHLGIIGSDVLSHPQWEDIIKYAIKNAFTVNFSSLSAVTLSRRREYLSYLVKCGIKTLTLAPESGDAETRQYFGKGLDDEEWTDLIQNIFQSGIPKVKLYFMIGKAFHSAEKDLDFIHKLSRKINSKHQLSVSYSFLVPKPHTDLENMKSLSFLAWKKERELFETGLKKMKIRFSGESLRVAWIELLLARADRFLAQEIPNLMKQKNGLVFNQWKTVLKKMGREFDEWPRHPWEGDLYPWSIIDNHERRL